MEYIISDKMNSLKPSAIREIFKYASDPQVITLAAGSPAPEALPVDRIREITGRVLETEITAALQYSQSEGHPPFREALLDYLRKDGIAKDTDRIMITSGAQQCMDLVAKTLCNEGDAIICEDPSFIGSLNTFRSYNANLVGVPMEQDGICLDALEEALKSTKNARFIYLIPNFQNPTGITMSAEKRKAVYRLAQQYNLLILEDNPYGDLRFEGDPIPTIKSLDTEGRVLYAGTFSKILSPGIRVGYLLAPEGIFGKLTVAKQCTDVHTSMLAQLLCHHFLTETDMPEHLKSISKIYAHKCGLMLQTMEALFPKSVRYTRPQGGLFIWASLPDAMDSTDFVTRLVREKKVCVVPGSAFSTSTNAVSSSFRMNFSTPTDENMIKALEITAALLNEIC